MGVDKNLHSAAVYLCRAWYPSYFTATGLYWVRDIARGIRHGPISKTTSASPTSQRHRRDGLRNKRNGSKRGQNRRPAWAWLRSLPHLESCRKVPGAQHHIGLDAAALQSESIRVDQDSHGRPFRLNATVEARSLGSARRLQGPSEGSSAGTSPPSPRGSNSIRS